MQMFTAQFTQKNCIFWQGSSTCDLTSHVARNLSRILPIIRNMSSECGPSEEVCSGNGTAHQRPLRPYQVVVAATRDMGIGKDGKLPWALPSDLRYFKEVTTTTAVAGKRNAVIMGRRTWESIPQRFQPLRGRLNVVLSRSGKMGFAAMQDVVICSDLCAALELVTEPPLSSSVEKVFVIGGGQVLKEALNAPGCEAIHLTDIKTSVECDTFIPRIDSSSFCPLFSSREMVENNIRFSFLTYIRAGNHDLETNEVNAGLMSRRHADFDYLKQIQERIANSDTVVE